MNSRIHAAGRLEPCFVTMAWPTCLQEHVLPLVQQALKIAGLTPADLTCIAYTKVNLCSECHLHVGYKAMCVVAWLCLLLY